jgi:hypothetical protein
MTEDLKDVEGHKKSRAIEDDDVEGHKLQRK